MLAGALHWRICCAFLLALSGAAHGAASSLASVLHLEHAELLVTNRADTAGAPATVDSRQLAGAWEPVALPYAQPADGLHQAGSSGGDIVTLWYRLRVPDFAPAPEALMLYAARVKAYGPIAIYIDGRLHYQRQLDGPGWYWEPLWLAIDGGQRSAQPREILVRMQAPRHLRSALASMWLGPSDLISWRFKARQWLQVYLPVMSIGAFLAVGVFSFVIWCRRGGAGYGYFAILALAQFIRSLSFFSTVRLNNDWFAWCMLNSLFWIIAIVHAFQVYTHGRRQQMLSNCLIAMTISVGVFSLPLFNTGGDTPVLMPVIYLFAMAGSVAVSIAGVLAGWRRHSEAVLMSLGVFLCVFYGISDWALQSNFLGPESWYLGPYINLQNFALLCYLIYRRYMGAQAQVEDSNRALAQRLQQREVELADTYVRLRAVEHTQTLATERQRLLQDMHDGLGSSLHTALRAIEDGQPDTPAVSDVLRFCIDDLHLTIDSLEPVESDLLMLLATLRYRLGGRLAQAGIALRWEVVNVPPLAWIDPRTALHILRILQEALVNVVKHSGATEIVLATRCAGAGVQVEIRDNGCGFDSASTGTGMLNQRRRAAALGGNISWDASAAGSRVLLWLPLAGPAALSQQQKG